MTKESVFSYEILSEASPSRRIAEELEEELNRGFSFVVTRKGEKPVSLSGRKRKWARSSAEGNAIRILVSDDFFLSGSVIDQVVTSLWANLQDFGILRLEDFQLSNAIGQSMLPRTDVRLPIPKLLGRDGPYFGTVYKPQYCLNLRSKIRIAKRFALLGGSFIKEDETYFVDEHKLLNEAKAIQGAMNQYARANGRCMYVPNVTNHIQNEHILQQLPEAGVRVVMVDYLIAGIPTIYRMRERAKDMAFWGHRVGYKTIERHMSMKAVAKLLGYSGFDMIHVGTPGMTEADLAKSHQIVDSFRKVARGMLPVFTKTSIGITQEMIHEFGRETILMACGGIRTKGEIDWKKAKKWMECSNA